MRGQSNLLLFIVVVKLVKKEYLDILISIYFSVLGAFGPCTARLASCRRGL